MKGKAVGLFSGGLDSILSALLIKEQGFEVHLLHFISPFFGFKGDGLIKLEKKVEELGMSFHAIVVGDDYVETVLKGAQHGTGVNVNACIDCHKFMLMKANDFKNDIGAMFVFTGEVLGQRPMSQTRRALNLLAASTGLEGYLLRPLSARLLDPTVPELEGMVDRSKLLRIVGRGRKEQFALAKEKQIGKYPQPAGGCRFTDPNIVKKYKKITELAPSYTWKELSLVLIGRHFYLGNGNYLIITRDEPELDKLSCFSDLGFLIEPSNKVPGPTGLLLSFYANEQDVVRAAMALAGSIISRYTRGNSSSKVPVDISYYEKGYPFMTIECEPIDDDELKVYRL